MNTAGKQLCDMLAEKLATQTPHPVHPCIEMMEAHPERLEATIRMGSVVDTLPLEKIDLWRRQREALLVREKDDPLRFLCEPDEYRLIDLECARKRRNFPGVPLLLWLSGGIRSAKTWMLSRRVMAVHWHTAEAWTWCFHETDTTSVEVQQPLIYSFVPAEIRASGSKLTQNAKRGLAVRDTSYFSYSEGKGFTGSKFKMRWHSHDWRGCSRPGECTERQPCPNVIEAAGLCEFRFYKQDEGTLVGQKLTCVLNDEKVPPSIIKLEKDRLLQRSKDTATPDYLRRLDAIIAKLESGVPADIYDLACIYLGWQLNSFTPKWGWSGAVPLLMTAARLYGEYDPRPMIAEAMAERIAMEPDLVRLREIKQRLHEKPWTLGGVTSVPRFAQPVDTHALVAFLPTWANKFGGNWAGMVESLQGKPDDDIYITAFGLARNHQQSLLPYEPKRHVLGWESVSFMGTIYEVADPAPGKPWVIKWYVVDPANRRRVVLEWPCTEWEIEGVGLPDAWAHPTQKDKLNGDRGEIAAKRLGWGLDNYTRLIWQGRQRLADKFRREAIRRGVAHSIPAETLTLEWSDKPEWRMTGEFVKVARTLGDKHYLSLPTQTDGGTLLLELLSQENALEWEEATAAREAEGLILLGGAMGKDIMGLPRISCVPECTNTQFAWATYTIPPDKQSSLSTDEACKDFVDPDRYLEMEGDRVEYTDPKMARTSEGGCRD